MSVSCPTLRDPSMGARLAQDGYALSRCLDRVATGELRARLWELHEGDRTGFDSSASSPNRRYREALDALLTEALQPVIDDLFVDHQIFQSGLLIKWPSGESTINVHQDWTFVDETRFRSISIWCPLDDVDSSNGALCVLPGSHRALPGLRPRNGWPQSLDPLSSLETSDLTPLPMTAGHCVLLDHGTVHCSPPNRTGRPRIAAAVAVAPREASLYDCYRWADDTAELIEVRDRGWFRRYDLTAPPAGAVASLTRPVVAAATRGQILQRCRDASTDAAEHPSVHVNDKEPAR